MRIDDLFEQYPNNIIGFRVNKNTKIIDFWLSDSWELLDDIKDGIAIKKQKNDEPNKRSYYIIYSEMFDFETIFNELSDIIEYNLDIERKQHLFTTKIDELKNLFVTLSYDELKKISFDTAAIDPISPISNDDDSYSYKPDITERSTKTNKKTKKEKKPIIEKEVVNQNIAQQADDDYNDEDFELMEGDVNNIKPVNLN